MCHVVEVKDDTSEEGVKIDLNLGTGAELVLDFGRIGSKSLPVFEDYSCLLYTSPSPRD